MNRAKLMVDLIKLSDEKAAVIPVLDKEAAFEDFPEKNFCESTPASVLCTARHIPSVQAPYSAPQPTDINNDLITIEDLCCQDNKERIALNSPCSEISGVQLFSSSPVRDFSDSSVSWFPGSDEDRRTKQRNRVFIGSSSTDSDDSEYYEYSHRQKKHKAPPVTIAPSDESISNSSQNTTGILQLINDSALIGCSDNTQISSNKQSSPKRWKKSDPSKWKKNKTRDNRNNCLPYQSKSGKTMPAKKPKPVKCTDNCRFKCSYNFSDDARYGICKNYWVIKDYVSKKQFLLKHVIATPIKRMKVGVSDNKRRKASYEYYLFKNQEKHRVCKDFFLKTLCISNGPVNKAFMDVNEYGNYSGIDKRGSRDPVNKTSPESEQQIIEHINSFPRQESHYCRKKSKRQYLESNLTISKMYELYKNQINSGGGRPASIFVYKRIFGTKFNLSFFSPKKDLCMSCTRYDNAGRPGHLKAEYDAHIFRKNAAQDAKTADKQRSINDPTYLVVTADMQSTLQIPVCGAGILYYSRKLTVQNYTIHTAKPPNEAYCIVWNEVNGKRGSIEIATAMNWWFSQVPPTVKEVTIYSDTCAGQNRNQYITAFLVFTIQRPDVLIEILEQKYLESGHTHMEVDSMHSAIERQQRHTSVYSMIDWKNIMQRARSTRHRESAPPYIVHELTFEDMIDIRALHEHFVKNVSKDKEGNKIMWLKIKCLRVEKEFPGIVKYRYSHDGPYSEFDIFQKVYKPTPRTRNRKKVQENQDLVVNGDEVSRENLIQQLKLYEIPKSYSAPLAISMAKKKDLLNLCVKGVIPRELHPWYESLPVSNDVVDRLCEPDVNELEEEEENDIAT